VEPALLVVLKQLDPLVAVLCLIACVLVCAVRLHPASAL